jgi:FAD/FMN-containing dehydrogenase
MNSDVLGKLKSIVGPKSFSEDPADLAPYAQDWRGKFKGHTPLLLLPASTAEVSAILTLCNESRTPVVPQSGNTGLVGSQIPLGGEVILCPSRMNRIRNIDAVGYSLTADAGVVLQTAQAAADEHGLLLPISMASEGSCLLGGAISSNAGGMNVLRYGMTREQVLGLEVVLADGRVLDILRTLRKDNTGYDLKQLFIGAEGTLGVVTAVALKLFPKSVARATALVAVPDVEAAISLLNHLQAATEGKLNSFEIFCRLGLELVVASIAGLSDPLGAPSPWYVLCEASGSDAVGELLESALGSALEEGLASDAVLASSEAQRTALWKIRECLSEAEKNAGPSLKHDISVPIPLAAEFMAKATQALTAAVPGCRPMPFGHLGDGGVHYNILGPAGGDGEAFAARSAEVARIVHDIALSLGGSFSAEHGIGVMKRNDLLHYRSPVEVEAMRILKRAFDPNGILNPGKLLTVS